jgi:predicted  nucleic acid-binding Zn-ribbon protein
VTSAFVTFTCFVGETVAAASISYPAGGCRDHVTVHPLFASPLTRPSAAVMKGAGCGGPLFALWSAASAAGRARATGSTSAGEAGADAEAEAEAEAEADADADADAEADAGVIGTDDTEGSGFALGGASRLQPAKKRRRRARSVRIRVTGAYLAHAAQ